MDDNEFARYLASYLVQNQDKFISEDGKVWEEFLEKTINEYINSQC